jgi:hypothetical protein
MTDLEKLYATAENAGLKLISDDDCCKLLAWLHVYGGGDESVVKNEKLKLDILTAQKRLNLFGGKRPHGVLIEKLKKYIKIADTRPDWIASLEQKYHLKK